MNVTDDRLANLEGQLENMTAKWMQRGEDVEYLASELREAKYALRKIGLRAERGNRYRERASTLMEIGDMAREALA